MMFLILLGLNLARADDLNDLISPIYLVRSLQRADVHRVRLTGPVHAALQVYVADLHAELRIAKPPPGVILVRSRDPLMRTMMAPGQPDIILWNAKALVESGLRTIDLADLARAVGVNYPGDPNSATRPPAFQAILRDISRAHSAAGFAEEPPSKPLCGDLFGRVWAE